MILKKRLSKRVVIAIAVVTGVLYMLPLQYFLSSPSPGSFYSMITADRGVSIERGISYGPNARHKLDIYRPTKDDNTGPIVIFFYGGRWSEGERAIYGFLGAALASRGITTIIPDYRLHPEVMFPTFIDDAAKAYGWVHDNLTTAPLGEPHNSRPIILMGHSAGAHIAALLTLDQRYLAAISSHIAQPAGLISLAGPLAFDPTTDPTTKDIFASAKAANSTRPIHFVRPNLPPTLLIHGLNDETVGLWNSRDFAKALIEKKGEVCKLELPGIGHVGLVLAVSKPLRWRGPVLEASVKFIKGVGEGKIDKSDIGC